VIKLQHYVANYFVQSYRNVASACEERRNPSCHSCIINYQLPLQIYH